MRLRSRKRERPLSSKRSSQVTKFKKKPLNKKLSKPSPGWTKILNRDVAKNALSTPSFCITRSQNLKTRPVRTRLVKSMEKSVDTSHKAKLKHKDGAKKPIFQTVVRNTSKDTVTSSTNIKNKVTQNDKVTTTSKTKEIRTTKSVQLRHSSLNRELRKTEVSTAMNSPRKTRRMDKPDKSASLNSSPIRKVRQMGLPSPKLTKVTSTNESPKKKGKSKAPVVPENGNWTEDNDVTMYEAHTTFVDFPTPKSEESDSDAQVESSELCLPNDCLNDFMAIAECARLMNENLGTEDEVNYLADKAARVMTTEKEEVKKTSRKNSVEKRLIKRRKSSNDLEMYQPTSTTDDLDSCTDFLSNGEKYVQVCILHH